MSLVRKLKLSQIVEVEFTTRELYTVNYIKEFYSNLKVITDIKSGSIHSYLKNGNTLLKVLPDNKIEISKCFLNEIFLKRKDILELLKYLIPKILKEQDFYIDNPEFVFPNMRFYTQLVGRAVGRKTKPIIIKTKRKK